MILLFSTISVWHTSGKQPASQRGWNTNTNKKAIVVVMIFLYKLLPANFVFILSVKGLPLGVYLQAHDGILPEIKWPTWLSEDCKKLILKMIRYEPGERCSISQVCEGLREIRLDSGKLSGRLLAPSV